MTRERARSPRMISDLQAALEVTPDVHQTPPETSKAATK